MKEGLKNRVDNLIEKAKAQFISSDTIYKDNFINVLKELYQLPNGKIITRDRIIKNKNKESVIILAETIDKKYLVVFQNRVNNITSIEFPAGYMEETETPLDAAKRELKEETGYVSNNAIIIDDYLSQIGIDSSRVYIVLLKDCVKKCNQKLGESEYIKYMEVTLNEIKELIHFKYINGGGNKLAFYKLLSIQEKNKLYKSQK